MNIKKKVMIACTNANGESDLFVCTVEVSEAEYDNGIHFDRAIEMAENEGYDAPYVCFDEQDQKNIARHVSKLDCPVPFELKDKESTINGNLLFEADGIGVQLMGYSDCCSTDHNGIVFLEYWDGSVNLRAYSDINSEEPTDNISLEGARNECRVRHCG